MSLSLLLTQLVPVAKLYVNPLVQRAAKTQHADRIAVNFKPEVFGTLSVSKQEDGRYVILDGQHRFLALQSLGYTGDVSCFVYENLTRKQEAQMFLDLNAGRSSVSALDNYRVGVYAGIAMYTRISHHAALSELSIGDKGFKAVASLYGAYSAAPSGVQGALYGEDLAAGVIDIIARAWPASADQKKVTGTLSWAIVKFLRYHNNMDIDENALVLALQAKSIKQLVEVAKAQSVVADDRHGVAMYKAIVKLYNAQKPRVRLTPKAGA